MEQNKQAADVLIEFLKSAADQGSVIGKLEELKNEIQKLEALKAENISYESLISEKLKAVRDTEHIIGVRQAELLKEQDKLRKEVEDFEAVKFAVKKDKEYAEALSRSTNDKLGELDAKLKRLTFEEDRVNGLELSLKASKKNLEDVVSSIKKAAEGL